MSSAPEHFQRCMA